MPKYKFKATKDVAFVAMIEAESEEEAWAIARGDRFFNNTKLTYKLPEAEWKQVNNGHDCTLEPFPVL